MKSESEVTQSCPTLSDPMECSLPGSSIHGIFQARVLEWVANKADVLLELSCFVYDPADVGNLISGSSAFSKTSLYIRKFTVNILLKPGLENFAHYFTSV